jgi:hypothetical protein
MLCNDQALAYSLRLCAEDDAIIYIGQSECVDLVVQFTDLATGRVIHIDAEAIGDDHYIFASDLGINEFHSYSVQLLNLGVPVPFTPYVMEGCDIEPATEEYSQVVVSFAGIITPRTSYYTNTDQWLTIY